jgi:non-heme chloroperoxidase
MESLALLATNLQTAPAVRMALFNRKCANDDVLEALRMPVLVTHGTDDIIIDVATAHHIVSKVPGAELSLYEKCGHTPFLDHTERFNRELSALAQTVR